MTKASKQDEAWLRAAITLGAQALEDDEGGPFGAIVVRGDEVVGRGRNLVLATPDPTAHAEMVALREAAAALGTHELQGCVLYSSCEPCPMCLGATYWARVDRLVFAASRLDAASIGFDDAFLYEELTRPISARRLPSTQDLAEEGRVLMRRWAARPGRRLY